ncbi:rod shape-determining protein RodA [Massilia sp. PAMC28688]|uniref:rod shape-determining protein RodA n=1 Tax=Massilia sp. PAMC28688 TaxID=2861283 RepID=UPI001C62E5F5|nr:rod shape-determining protein RodA [Massilia sp. PAMC28688]QYF94550.1 rod shape-determining protein RodA [Massilia sp. PAMC28688]
MRINERRSLWRRMKPYLLVFDAPLAIILFLLLATSIVTMYSAGIEFPGRVQDQIRNTIIAFIIMWVMALIPPQTLLRLAVPIYAAGVALLLAVFFFGIIKKGARRWLYVGVDIQPSEILKIAMPLMLAWYFHQKAGAVRWHSFVVAAALLAVPVGLIQLQPDLGTSLLVLSSGLWVIFLAGLSWKAVAAMFVATGASLPIAWSLMHDYQRDRVMMLIDPTTDPLGKGFHIIQSVIAIGSGGFSGKGYMQGSQSHLEFVPEHTTDFVFALYAEEFGLVGILILLTIYLLLVGRGLMIAANAPNLFSRLLAAALTMNFFTYAFVNMGMVSGILPVVGVPLPFMSYGGTAFVTLGLGAGILMSISRHRKLIQT